jgi:hypothetical protein
MPGLRGTSDDESEIILEILLDARNQVLSNAEELLAAERAYEVDIELERVPVDIRDIVKSGSCVDGAIVGRRRNKSKTQCQRQSHTNI